MTEPLIFSQDEQHERFLFHMFYTQTFITHQSSTDQFRHGLDAKMLLEIYKTRYPSTILTEDIVHHILLFGGYIANDNGLVFCDINESNFAKWPHETQAHILRFADYAKTIKLRRLMAGKEKSVVSPFDEIADYGLRYFMQNYIFWKGKFAFYSSIAKGQNKGKPLDLYKLYQTFCLHYGFIPVARRLMMSTISKKGGVMAKTYYMGQAGVTVFSNLCIPLTEEDQQRSIEYGVGTIRLDKKCFFNDNRSVDEFTEDGLTAYLNGRKDGIHEPYTKTTRAEDQAAQAPIILRSETENPEADVQRGTKESGTENRSEASDGSIEDTPKRTSRRSNAGKSDPKSRTFTNRDNKHEAARNTRSGNTEDRYAEDQCLIGDDGQDEAESGGCLGDSSSESEGLDEAESTGTGQLAKQDVIDMLVLTCRANPHNISKEDMEGYLTIIREDNPKVGSIDLYWDDLQHALGKK